MFNVADLILDNISFALKDNNSLLENLLTLDDRLGNSTGQEIRSGKTRFWPKISVFDFSLLSLCLSFLIWKLNIVYITCS